MKKEFKYSSKVTFREGDKMRVSGGPYFPSSKGKNISMGEKGVFIFSHADDQGNIWAKDKNGHLRLIYMGEEHVSDLTGTVKRPHKLVKIRKKKISG